MLSRTTRIPNVAVVCCIVFMLAFMAISVNCEVESTEDWPDSMFIKPDRIILNANSAVNYVMAQFPGVIYLPSEVENEGFASFLTLTKDGAEVGTLGCDSHHYCVDDDILQIDFVRQDVKALVENTAGDYTATVTVTITFKDGSTLELAGKDDTVELVRQGGGSGK